MTVRSAASPAIYQVSWTVWLLFGVTLAIVAAGFRVGLENMVAIWFGRDEYSHGVLIPLISAFLVWQKKDALELIEFRGSWMGVVVVVLGAGLQVLGDFATLFVVQQYALLLVLYGLVLAFAGWQVVRLLAVPLLILVFMIPLPEFLLQNFSAQLQLISSQIGVWFIRLFGISVFVEGNVIDLGSYKLQVAEACSGLRYLFPLMTLGFIMAYFYKAAFWKRAVLFLSSIPITLLMNCFRIGTIGVMVEHWGVRMAEGFLHEFQGWVVFMASGALLVGEVVLLTRFGREGRHWREVFGLEFPAPAPAGAVRSNRPVPSSFVVAGVLVTLLSLGLSLAPERQELIPARTDFSAFPNQIDSWSGRKEPLEREYLDALKLDDYVMANYQRNGGELVNFYVAWYESQRTGNSAHSPRSCIPGGGWRITSLEQVALPGVMAGNVQVVANRALIEFGDQKQVVYYWFQQRGRVITNEYMAKWYLFWDALTRNRTDGALVRLVAPLNKGEDVAAVDRRIVEFASRAVPRLEKYVPG